MKAQEDLPEGCLYTSLGEVVECEGWNNPQFPYIRDVKVEAYEGYTILRGWAGVEGYDIMVEFDEKGNLTSMTPIVNGEEGEMVTSGYITIYSGREDFEYIQPYIGSGYGYAAQNEEESGYVIFCCYLGEEWTYYYCTWPQSENGPEEWVNPFESEATLLYSAVAKTGDAGEEWGSSLFPVVENINVDVYDKYVYIHALGGVEGYDAKVAYDADGNVTSIIAITNGEESSPSKSAASIYTGREDKYCLFVYHDYSFVGRSLDNSGYVLLGCYIYNPDNSYDWSYYYISWSQSEEESSDLDITSRFTYCWKEASETLTVGDDGVITYNGVQWGGVAAWLAAEDGTGADWSAYNRIVFEFAEPTAIASQIFIQGAEEIKEWVNAGVTEASCSFEGKDVSAVTQIALQAADNGTLLIKRVYLASDTATGIQEIQNVAVPCNDAIYSLSGQKVSANYKGIVIKNGKKYMQK